MLFELLLHSLLTLSLILMWPWDFAQKIYDLKMGVKKEDSQSIQAI